MFALVYGGSGSGKSEFAENLLQSQAGKASPLIYVATMYPGDGEARARIARHQAMRAHKGFETVELYTNLSTANIPHGSVVLVECLGNLVANEIFSPAGAGAAALTAVVDGLDAVERRAGRVIVVSNDVFTDGVDYPPETEEYRRVLSTAHRILAEKSALVVETVCGIPLWHKHCKVWDQ